MTDGYGIGAAVPRKEDRRFLTGSGRFTDDLAHDGAAYAVVVRSPHPQARIAGIDASAAAAMPGVLAVLTARDFADVAPVPSMTRTPPFRVLNRDGSELPQPDQPVLAADRVRYAGEPVAFVVAESAALARDAADAVAVDYAPLAAVVGFEQATAPEAPAIHDDCPGNVSFEIERGDAETTEAAFASAAQIARVELVNNRVVVAFLEPRSAIASVDAASGRLTLHTGSQTAHRLHGVLASMLGLEPSMLRVVTPDTGGGFGARGGIYPELALVLLAARRLGRTVRWTAERAESFLTDTQARDHRIAAELALDADGRFTALRVAIDWRHGAWVPSRGIWAMTHFLPPTLGGVYAIPTMHLTMRGLFTNTTPLAAYRGIGRVEATYLIESLVDRAAQMRGDDRVELRRRNLVTRERMPWTAAGGSIYSDGDFAGHLDRALALSDWDGFETRRREAEARGRLRGIGLALYVENDGGAPSEYAEVEAAHDGGVTVRVGTQNFGMGHETVYAQVVAEQLGVDFASIRLVQGDTDAVTRGSGSHGSRSARVGGAAIVIGAKAMVERGKALAADLLEAPVEDVDYAGARFTITGTDRGATLAEVADFAAGRGLRLAGEADFEQGAEVHSNGAHVCELDVDAGTGAVTIVAHTMVADVGTALNPMIVDGQLHGGAAQGLGQAALECVVWDPETGQTLSGTLMDYALPRADDLPMFTTELAALAEPDNPLGVKGAGEGATTGAPAAFMNALRDALRPAIGDAADELQMPATPESVWRALERRR